MWVFSSALVSLPKGTNGQTVCAFVLLAGLGYGTGAIVPVTVRLQVLPFRKPPRKRPEPDNVTGPSRSGLPPPVESVMSTKDVPAAAIVLSKRSETGISMRPAANTPVPPDGIVTVVVLSPTGVPKVTEIEGNSVMRSVALQSSKLRDNRRSLVNGPRAFSLVVVIVAVPLKAALSGAAQGAVVIGRTSSTCMKSV
jgi:hypothetical protein